MTTRPTPTQLLVFKRVISLGKSPTPEIAAARFEVAKRHRDTIMQYRQQIDDQLNKPLPPHEPPLGKRERYCLMQIYNGLPAGGRQFMREQRALGWPDVPTPPAATLGWFPEDTTI